MTATTRELGPAHPGKGPSPLNDPRKAMQATTVSRSARPAGSRVGYGLTAAVLVAVMLGGTLPIPLYTLYEPKMGFGPLGITVVFAVYVVGTLSALLAFGDLSDHFGRRKVLATAIGCAAASTIIFLFATGIGELIAARVISGAAAGFATGTASAALAELQPRRNLVPPPSSRRGRTWWG